MPLVQELSAAGACRAEIEAALRHTIEVVLPRSAAPRLVDAARHAVLGGGKRVRPALVLLAAEAAGGDRAAAMPAAVAVELVHCFSLVHDDLPALDNDVLRRGRPTVHVVHGEATALLTGDLLLALAFAVLTEGDRPPGSVVRMTTELASATIAMVDGQTMDTVGGVPASLAPVQRLEMIQRGKTGALIRASCVLGGLAVEAGPEALHALRRYGDAIGLLFQVVDDLLDTTQTTEHVGKTTGKDRARGRLTWPEVLGVDGARSRAQELAEAAASSLAPLGAAADRLRTLAGELAVRTR